MRFGTTEASWQRIEQLWSEDWSREQISLWLIEAQEPRVSHESIYQYINRDKNCGRDSHTHLRYKKKRCKRYGTNERRGKLTNKVSIDDRPAVVEKRERADYGEADTIIGNNHKQTIASITERELRLTYLCTVESKDAESVELAIVKTLKSKSLPVLRITADKGREFGNHMKIAEKLDTKFYFAHPYCSWERGANEKTAMDW